MRIRTCTNAQTVSHPQPLPPHHPASDLAGQPRYPYSLSFLLINGLMPDKEAAEGAATLVAAGVDPSELLQFVKGIAQIRAGDHHTLALTRKRCFAVIWIRNVWFSWARES